MAFITMPAPKVGTTFYDKPGNGRKLHKLKRLQDNKVICTPANDDGKEALILPIEAWEKLTGYKIGPDLLATMTFSRSAPVAAVPELAVPESVEEHDDDDGRTPQWWTWQDLAKLAIPKKKKKPAADQPNEQLDFFMLAALAATGVEPKPKSQPSIMVAANTRSGSAAAHQAMLF